MTSIPTELRELLERIVAGDVGRMIYAKLATRQATETDDGKAWLELRALLATPPADAADMGGQAGEEVLAVVTLGGLFHGGSGPELGDIDIEPDMRALERVQCELVNSSDDTHIELIDRRILAQHRQQAGKLAEALRACRSDLHAMIKAHNVQSEHDGSWLYDYQTVSEADEALADWEKTSCGK